jgi:hypothetical protein
MFRQRDRQFDHSPGSGSPNPSARLPTLNTRAARDFSETLIPLHQTNDVTSQYRSIHNDTIMIIIIIIIISNFQLQSIKRSYCLLLDYVTGLSRMLDAFRT